MSFENPMRKRQPSEYTKVDGSEPRSLTPDEMEGVQEHFERAQEDGLTDAQRTALDSVEGEMQEEDGLYKRLQRTIDEVEKGVVDLEAMPSSSREKYDAAYRLRNTHLNRLELKISLPVSLWPGRSDDEVYETVSKTPRFQELKNRYDAFESARLQALEDLNTAWSKAREEFEAANPEYKETH